MRSKNWQDIQDAIPVSTGIAGATGLFGPTIDNITVFSDYVTRSAAGNFIKRPLFLGSNNYEVGVFRVIFDAQNVTFSEAQWDYLNFVIFTCPTGYRAEASVNNNIPTWRYRYFGEFPNLRLTNSPDSGTWHGSEVPLIFNTDKDLENIVVRTREETEIADYLRKAWVAFATDPENGLTTCVHSSSVSVTYSETDTFIADTDILNIIRWKLPYYNWDTTIKLAPRLCSHLHTILGVFLGLRLPNYF